MSARHILKLLVFAHKPPPHHGQSYMVQLLLDALGGDVRQREAGTPVPEVCCYHLDARFSATSGDIGKAGAGKVLLAFRFVLTAIWWRVRHGVANLYYIPAPPLRAAVYRDWIVLGLCRPFFRRTVYHWHAAGLGEWLQKQARPWERWISQFVYAGANPSIVLRGFNRTDGVLLRARRIVVTPNGIPDPCPAFDTEVLPRRLARVSVRKALLARRALKANGDKAAGDDAPVFRVLFLSLCFREKGLFDAVEAIALARRQLEPAGISVRLAVAGAFWVESERKEFEERIRQPDLQEGGQPMVEYHGFAAGDAKRRLYLESDCLCFPTYYSGESFGLVLLEGMAFGLPLVATTWRDIPEILPANSPGIVPPQSPGKIADALVAHAGSDYDPGLRAHFLAHYTVERFASRMREVLLSVEGNNGRGAS